MKSAFPTAAAAILAISAAANAAQFSYLDPAFTQEIYTGPLVGGPGMAWTSSGNLLSRDGATLIEYSPTQNTTHLGDSLHGSIGTYTVPGLDTLGTNMTKGLDGYIYAPGPSGLQRINPSNWAQPAVNLGGGSSSPGYGATTLPDGRIAYTGGPGSTEIWVYNPSGATNTLLYTAPGLVDDIEASATGHIALAGQTNSNIIILNSSGAVVNTFSTAHYPDGLAFGGSGLPNALFSNNNDGTITQYVFGSPAYTGAPLVTDIATGSGAYGDLAAVGPDCAFYVSQFNNYGYHGSTNGVGTNWTGGTNGEPSIVRIALAPRPDGTEVCGFHSVSETSVPEPGALALMLGGLVPLMRRRARRG